MSSSAFTPSNNLAIPATTTQAGTVTTVAQTFAGKKTFDGGVALKGDTSGAAIASGYVGENLSVANIASFEVASNNYNTVLSKTLTPGIYLVSGSAKFLSGGATFSSDLFVAVLATSGSNAVAAAVDDSSGATGWSEKTIITPTIVVRCDGTNLYTPDGTIVGTTLNLNIYPGIFTGTMNVSNRRMTIVRIA